MTPEYQVLARRIIAKYVANNMILSEYTDDLCQDAYFVFAWCQDNYDGSKGASFDTFFGNAMHTLLNRKMIAIAKIYGHELQPDGVRDDDNEASRVNHSDFVSTDRSIETFYIVESLKKVLNDNDLKIFMKLSGLNGESPTPPQEAVGRSTQAINYYHKNRINKVVRDAYLAGIV